MEYITSMKPITTMMKHHSSVLPSQIHPISVIPIVSSAIPVNPIDKCDKVVSQFAVVVQKFTDCMQKLLYVL